ncbi:MAG TPA: hypothetical protein VL197_05775 [Nitrospirota bacterium]|nr:hypothetical protein [Nitrospirota bacterium]
MIRIFRTSCLLLLFLAPFAASAENSVLSLQKSAHFSGDLSVPAAVRNDCQLETKVIDYIESFAGDEFGKVALVETASSATVGKALAITITGLSGEAGGAWSGPKHLSIAGTLWQDGTVIGTFTANRVTGGGAWGMYRGTCSLLGRCARALGKDVAGWLKTPTLDAKLGDVN